MVLPLWVRIEAGVCRGKTLIQSIHHPSRYLGWKVNSDCFMDFVDGHVAAELSMKRVLEI
jgi:hypothetical protein